MIFPNDNRTVGLCVHLSTGGLPETTTTPPERDRRGFRRFHGRPMRVCQPMYTPIEMTEPSSTITPSTTGSVADGADYLE